MRTLLLTATLVLATFLSTMLPGGAVPLAQFLVDPKIDSYKKVNGVPLEYAMFKPADWKASDQRPAIVFIHGGAWTAGDGRIFFTHARYFATRGAVCLSIEYRLEKADGSSSFANCLTDCKSAMRYFRGNAAKLGIDPNKIAVFGDSAGGHLAAALGTCPGFDDPEDNLAISAVPEAMILCNPILDMTEGGWIKNVIGGAALGRKPTPEELIPTAAQTQLAQALSPQFQIKPNLPPILLMQGTADTIVHPAQAKAFADAEKRAGNLCELIWMQGSQHAFIIPGFRAPESVVVEAINHADTFLGSLGWLAGPPTLTISDPPAWIPKK